MNAADSRLNEEASWWSKARDAYFDDAFAQALVYIERFRISHPNDELGCLIYGMVLTKLRRFDEARVQLDKAPTSRGRVSKLIYIAWKEFYDSQGKYAEAAEWCRRIIEKEPEDTGGYIFLGGCLAQQGKLKEAESVHRHATTLQGLPDEAFLNLGYVLRAQGRFAEAKKAFESALALCPDYPLAEEALKDVRAAIKLQKEAKCETMSDAAHIKITRDEMSGMYYVSGQLRK